MNDNPPRNGPPETPSGKPEEGPLQHRTDRTPEKGYGSSSLNPADPALPVVEDSDSERFDAAAQTSVESDVPGTDGEDSTTDACDSTSGSQDDPQFDSFPSEETQLSALEGVGEGMGTIALERIPGDQRAAEQVAQLSGSGLGQLTDAEIMQRAGTGDDACFEFLVAKYRRPIVGFMYRMVHNQAIAEELAQEVFLRVYRARASYRADARFTTWLYRIASNMAINHARDTKYERTAPSVFLDHPEEETGAKPDVADFRPLAEQKILGDERAARIRGQVMALPERQKMAVIMHKYQDMDYKQIGAVLKLSESATKSLLFRAYQTLRDRLKEFA